MRYNLASQTEVVASFRPEDMAVHCCITDLAWKNCDTVTWLTILLSFGA